MLLNTDLKIRNKINYDKDINKHDSFVLKKSSGDCLKLAKHVIQHLSEMTLFLNYCIIAGSAEALVRCGGKL